MQFSPVPSYPAETEWSELRLTKCAQQAEASPVGKALRLCRQSAAAFGRFGRRAASHSSAQGVFEKAELPQKRILFPFGTCDQARLPFMQALVVRSITREGEGGKSGGTDFCVVKF